MGQNNIPYIHEVPTGRRLRSTQFGHILPLAPWRGLLAGNVAIILIVTVHVPMDNV